MTSPPLEFGLPIPALLWETFEEALKGNVRKLAKDIATTLGQPDAPLMDALFKKGYAPTVRPYIFEEGEAAAEKELEMRCCAVCQRPDTPLFLQPCGQPVLWCATTAASPRCPQHLYSKAPGPEARNLPLLFPLEMGGVDAEEFGEQLYRSEDGTVYTKEFACVGRYHFPSKRLFLFSIA